MASAIGAAASYDAIVIGGGHNGLVTAAYLGKAGLRTVVLERRDALGGAARTSELAPGARVPTLAHTVGRLRPSVVRDLDLKRHGLSLVGPDVRVFAPGVGGDAVVLWGDIARTAEGLRARSAADAERYAGLRPARPCPVRLPRRAGGAGPAGHRLTRSRRRAGRSPPRANVPWPRARRRPDDHPRPADGRRRLRGRIVRQRCRPCRHRLARRPVHGDGAVVGRHDRGAADRCGRQRRGSGRPDGLRPRRPGRAGGGAGSCRARRRRGDPDWRGGRGHHLARRPRDRRGPGRPARRSPHVPSSPGSTRSRS